MDEKSVKRIDDPFKILDQIAEVGKIEETFKLTNDISVILSTINAEEEAEIFHNCSGFEGMNYITRNKIETLAYAIKGLNNVKFDYDKIEEPEKKKEERKKVVDGLRIRIGTWRDEIVTFLYDKLLGLMGHSEERLKKLGIVVKAQTKKVLDEIMSDLDKEANDKEEKKQEEKDIKS